jgi:hypothetical protein
MNNAEIYHMCVRTRCSKMQHKVLNNTGWGKRVKKSNRGGYMIKVQYFTAKYQGKNPMNSKWTLKQGRTRM